MEVNNFVSVDFETQVFIMVLNIMKFSTRIISQKGGGGGGGGKGKITGLWFAWVDQYPGWHYAKCDYLTSLKSQNFLCQP